MKKHTKKRKDTLAQAILQKVLHQTGFSQAVLAGDRSPGNVKARNTIAALMRSCVHPDCAQLSLRRIAAAMQCDACVVRWRLARAEPQHLMPWSFGGEA